MIKQKNVFFCNLRKNVGIDRSVPDNNDDSQLVRVQINVPVVTVSETTNQRISINDNNPHFEGDNNVNIPAQIQEDN